ncbi:hypothetical protein [Aureimonas sp. AU20]|uniref:hypothetical protein n=1 Tax=Aureimonas sp. AU20 TaxID=1349819 RepID=UPI00072232C5|nr:hypothetical protein [Aureimonas sp. AU20]ALN75847.1 hypothetical protein M673_24125 [Aureimonas sp. AU20]
MVEHGQVNVRIPSEDKELILRIARKLREEDDFAGRLKRWMKTEAEDPQSAFMLDRLDRLEARVAELDARLAQVGGGAESAASPPSVAAAETDPRQPDMFGGHKPKGSTPLAPPSSQWTTGDGKGRRMTPEGLAEMHRLLNEGRTDTEVAEMLGVRPFTVANQRKALRAAGRPTG